MKRTFKFIVFMFVLLLIGGVVGYQQFILADYTYTGDAKKIADVFTGTISFTGSGNDLTIREGSVVEWVTVLGNDNVIRIEDGATVAQIRGAGENNSVVAPDGVQVDMKLQGGNNLRQPPSAPSLDGL